MKTKLIKNPKTIKDLKVLDENYNLLSRELYHLLKVRLNISFKELQKKGFYEMCKLVEYNRLLPTSLLRELKAIHQIHEEFIFKNLNSVYGLGGTMGLLVETASDFTNPKFKTKSKLLRILLKETSKRLKNHNK
ncbi:hypothetical protein ACKGJO_05300 [Gracilimonas sp. Q87]|uniref:hypothetical protein n=1 Tax=Gracilimonas sp. Q87 TaxID=3384766 RepID=UPI0039844217